MSNHCASAPEGVEYMRLTESQTQEFHQIWRDLERHLQVSEQPKMTLMLMLNALVAINPAHFESARSWFDRYANVMDHQAFFDTIKTHPAS
ncbi:MAG: hypothetical protein WAQ22_02170 [Candidatus Saccharimonas sp.]